MCENSWGDLQPAGYQGGIFDVEGRGEAEASFVNGREELYVVLRREFSVKPLFVEVDRHVVERCGSGGVEAHGASGEGGVTGCSGSPQGLCDVVCEALATELL